MFSNKVSILTFLLSIGFISCWPNLFYYGREAPLKGKYLNNGSLSSTSFDKSKETKFLIHGFADNGDSPRINKLKDELLQHTDANIVIIDWGKGAAAPNYWAAVDNTRVVGRELSKFIVSSGIDPLSVHCIGHSLGAHCCGFTGKGSKLKRITGLDPAGPMFKGNPSKERLDKSDALLVDNIHTDAVLGIQDAIGHKDFYPNGGSGQCGGFLGLGRSTDKLENVDDDSFKTVQLKLSEDPRFDASEIFVCDHIRVEHFMAESVVSKCRFTSIRCNSYDDFKRGKCNCATNGCSAMGLYGDENNNEGKYYLTTNPNAPYCKN